MVSPVFPVPFSHQPGYTILYIRSDQIRSVAQSCPTLCDPMNRNTPGLPVHHQLPEFTETHVHRVSDAIQPSHPLSSPSPLCSIDYAKAFDCVDHNKLWKILKEMGIPDHLTCLLRNLYAGQEATVRSGHGTTD